jgi:hypothetical protein
MVIIKGTSRPIVNTGLCRSLAEPGDDPLALSFRIAPRERTRFDGNATEPAHQDFARLSGWTFPMHSARRSLRPSMQAGRALSCVGSNACRSR